VSHTYLFTKTNDTPTGISVERSPLRGAYYLHNDAHNPICDIAHNVASPEMLYISGSSGSQGDERARQLREAQDIVSAIETAISEHLDFDV
jgi:hypothetical protein